MIRRCLVVLVSVSIAAGCAEKRVAERPPSPPPPTLILRAILHEGYSGEVIRVGDMVLADSARDVHTTPLDSEGRFRFEVPAERLFLSLRWKPPQGNRNWSVKSTPTSGYADVPRDGRTHDVDFARVNVWLPEKAVELFGAACTLSGRVSTVPFTGFVPLINQDGSFRHWEHGEIMLSQAQAWPDGWSGVLCVSETTKKVGSYFPDVYGYETIWKVRMVRVPEGRVINKTLRTSPPEKTDIIGSGSKVTTDPMPLLVEWLKGLAPPTPDA